tara:strand:+ start:508 stop:669 length:162 start_codon:yes stop_codon:yes gene_type:complete
MNNYTVTVTQYNCFEIEADSEEDAKDIAVYNRYWDESDPNFECCIEAELQEEE